MRCINLMTMRCINLPYNALHQLDDNALHQLALQCAASTWLHQLDNGLHQLDDTMSSDQVDLVQWAASS